MLGLGRFKFVNREFWEFPTRTEAGFGRLEAMIARSEGRLKAMIAKSKMCMAKLNGKVDGIVWQVRMLSGGASVVPVGSKVIRSRATRSTTCEQSVI